MLAQILFPIHAEAFTYRVPEELQSRLTVGARVLAPFKKSEKVGIVQGIDQGEGKKDLGGIRLRTITDSLDEEPFVPANILKLISWVGSYYMSSSGLALKNAVPSAFFNGKRAGAARITYDKGAQKAHDHELTAEQKAALAEITSSDRGVFLLYGVTGSGKTEVYISAIRALPEDRQAIVLVPEIAITTQMIDRFRDRFGTEVLFFHSGLSVGERITQWMKMRNGEARVVIGVRSAVFAPFSNIGLIVIDEEQEASYKQFEGLRYNARDVALARAQLEGAKVVLGSATPSLEVYHAARTGKFTCLTLTGRVEEKKLPSVEIIDMTKEETESFSLSKKLAQELRENLSRGHQSLIMLNRRGYSPFFMCADCGHTYRCPACSITLIYHKDRNTLNCHYCGSYLRPGDTCPTCKGSRIKCLGTGTQRVEEEIVSLIPGLSFQRMDRDTTQKKLSHYRIVRQMEERKIDVLLGTQMVAKGHDFPDVALSAVISADIALNLPDFRSGERAFQLFTQLAGRAGRGDVPGRALIQTYEPDHYVFAFVKNHDYEGFSRQELDMRRDLSYPPFSRLIRIVLSFRTKERADAVVRLMERRIRSVKRAGIEILGPSPAPIERIRRLWRWHLILKGKRAQALRETAARILERMSDLKDVKVEIDVDPVNML